MTPDELLSAWHIQQTAFIEFREQRTRCMVDVLAELARQAGRPIRVLDLACGPASLGTAVLERLPDSFVTGVDRDPVLLRLGRETNRFADHLVLLDIDLRSPKWTSRLPEHGYDAVVSATALHWLQPGELAGVYQQMSRIMGPGAVFMNADHLFFDHAGNRFLDEFAHADRERVRLARLAQGAMSWDDWWRAALAMPGWEEETALWSQRWADKYPTVKVSLEFHLAALRAAGFDQTDQIYQWFDDRVVFGRLPDDWPAGGAQP